MQQTLKIPKMHIILLVPKTKFNYKYFNYVLLILNINSSDAIQDIANKMLGSKLITKQTHKEGILVKKVMVANSVNILRETYVSIIMDRQHNGPVIIASPAGGVDIEAVAEKTPHLIKTLPIDIFDGNTSQSIFYKYLVIF